MRDALTGPDVIEQRRIEATRLFNSKLREMFAPQGMWLDIASDVSSPGGTVRAWCVRALPHGSSCQKPAGCRFVCDSLVQVIVECQACVDKLTRVRSCCGARQVKAEFNCDGTHMNRSIVPILQRELQTVLM